LHPALVLKRISKRFGGVQALIDVDFTLEQGEVHALLGENGAGKSTLIKILTGVHQKDYGEMLLFNDPVTVTDPVDARFKGIAAIYQELSLVESLNVAQNIFLGHEPVKGFFHRVQKNVLLTKAREYLERFKIPIDPKTPVWDIGLGQKKIIEIMKALSIQAKILLLDEPTTGMSRAEIETLFQIIQDLKKKNVHMIYISHHLEEVFEICDRVTVLRDGKNAGTFPVQGLKMDTLVKSMIGTSLGEELPKKGDASTDSAVVLRMEKFRSQNMQKPVSFQLHRGEILGVTGIIGSGKSELGLALFGADPKIQGKVFVDAREVRFGSPLEAKKMGIGFIPEDRKGQGLFLGLSVDHNITVVALHQLERFGVLSLRKKKRMALSIAQSLKLNPLRIELPVHSLSGGNQQKIVLGKWFYRRPKILILDEPTRGVDVGAKREIYRLIRKWADQGVAVLLLSSEFKEVHEVCDRILVLYRGDLLKEIDPKRTTTEKIMSMALGEHV